MKKAVLVMAILPFLFDASGARHSSPDVFDRRKFLSILENVQGDTGQSMPPAYDGLVAIPQSSTPRAIINASFNLVKRGDEQPDQTSEAERLERARRRIEVLRFSHIPQPSRIPQASSSSAGRSSQGDRTATKAFNPPPSPRIPRAPLPNMQSPSQKGRIAQKESRMPSVSKIPKPPRFQQISSQEGRVTLGELTPSSVSRIPRLPQTHQASVSPQYQSSGIGSKASKLIRPSRSGEIRKENFENRAMDWNAKGHPIPSRLSSRPQVSTSAQLAGKVGVSSSSASSLSNLNTTSKPRQSISQPEEKSEVTPSQPQGSGTLDVIGTPSGLPRIKIAGDTTDRLYERLEQISGSSDVESSGAYFRHISMFGLPRAPVLRPPGIPRPPKKS